MPHIEEFRKKDIIARGYRAVYGWAGTLEAPGELVWLCTRRICELWRENKRFTTIFRLMRYRERFINEIHEKYKRQNSIEDVQTAWDYAVLDWYLNVGCKYEDMKKVENGNVYVEEDVLDEEGNLK